MAKSSTFSKSARHLQNNGNSIVWQMWKEAYEWDQREHSIKINERLTEAHFDLTPKSKMRNSLAEEVLDSKMLFLMKVNLSF